MAQDVLVLGNDEKMVLPDYLRQDYSDQPSNIVTDDRGAGISVRGKVFTLTAEGETTLITRRDKETGEDFPAQSLAVIVLDYGVRQGRSYYEGAFDPNETKEPTCWSKDGILPDESVVEKQSDKCATCPKAIKGSKVTDGNVATVACAPYRILAVLPAARPELPPLRLRIAQTSDYDGRSPDLRARGFFAFKNFLDSLKSRGLTDTKAIVVSLSFDPSAPYPKLLFRALRYVTAEQHARVKEIMASGQVEDILGDTGTAFAGRPRLAPPADSKPKTDTPEATAARRAAEAAAAQTQAKPTAQAPAVQVLPGAEFTFREMAAGEDEDDYNVEKATARKAFRQAQAEALAKAQAAAAQPATAAFRAQEAGEDDDDYAIARSQWNKAQKAKAAQPAEPEPVFEEIEGEDPDDRAIRKAQFNKAMKARANGTIAPLAPAAPTAQVEAPAATTVRERGKPSVGRQRRTKEEMAEDEAADARDAAAKAGAPKEGEILPPEKEGEILPPEKEKFIQPGMPGAMNGNFGDDDDDGTIALPGAKAAPAAASKAPTASAAPQRTAAQTLPAGTPPDVSSLLAKWGDDE